MCGPEPTQRSSLEHRQNVNRRTAQVIPFLLIALIGYATWVVVVLVCAHYLLRPGEETNASPRPGAAIAIIVIYFVLLFPVAVSYFRLIYVVQRKPGYIPQGQPSEATISRFEEEPESAVAKSCTFTTVAEKPASDGSVAKNGKEKKPKPVLGRTLHTLDLDAVLGGHVAPPPGLEEYISKEVYACGPEGLPIWCSVCCNWKPDRSHHCSDVGKCVMKLDHFCPWVAGVVSETSFKFFLQFLCYAFFYTVFLLVVMVYTVVKAKGDHTSLNVNWLIALGLAALFVLFTGGMAGKSMQDALNNLTTIDAIDHTRRTMFLAIFLNRPSSSVNGPPNAKIPWQGTITFPLGQDTAQSPSTSPRRTFAIVRTEPGTHPWNLGTASNFKYIMGHHWYDWFLPLRFSPCCDHDRDDSMYALGPQYQSLRREAGIDLPVSTDSITDASTFERERRKRRRSRRRPSEDSIQSMGSTIANVNGASGFDSRRRKSLVDSAPDNQPDGER